MVEVVSSQVVLSYTVYCTLYTVSLLSPLSLLPPGTQCSAWPCSPPSWHVASRMERSSSTSSQHILIQLLNQLQIFDLLYSIFGIISHVILLHIYHVFYLYAPPDPRLTPLLAPAPPPPLQVQLWNLLSSCLLSVVADHRTPVCKLYIVPCTILYIVHCTALHSTKLYSVHSFLPGDSSGSLPLNFPSSLSQLEGGGQGVQHQGTVVVYSTVYTVHLLPRHRPACPQCPSTRG